MPGVRRKDYFWTYLVWPLLWPLLLAQAALVLLCLVVGAVFWVAMPSPTSWAESAWLLLALLVGTTLTMAAFILQLRHRIRECEHQIESRLGRIDSLLGETEQQLPHWLGLPRQVAGYDNSPIGKLERVHDGLVELQARLGAVPSFEGLLMASQRPALLLYQGRIVGANRSMEKLLGESREELEGQDPTSRLIGPDMATGKAAEMQVLDSDGRWRPYQVEWLDASPYQLLFFERANAQELDSLMASRERAREDSRLKSRYLTLLQRELEPLLSELSHVMESTQERVDSQRHAHLRERIAEITLLIRSLGGEREAGQQELWQDARQAGTLRALIVDDGPVNRMLATQLLEGYGLRVDSVASGPEALEQQQRHAYDLVLMDIYMPGMDGIEAARRWREQEAKRPSAGRSILVALTANATDCDRRRFRDAGMDDYLAKPYGPRGLIELLRRLRPDAFEDPPAS